MPSSIAWIVRDSAEADHMNRLLAAFRQPEARDELGVGGLRDALADVFFPGTSTIQSRLRYFLLVPWCFRVVERRRVPRGRSEPFGAAVERVERDLIEPLARAEGAEGVFGASAGRRIKRLPSEVYWSGLYAWQIRKHAVGLGAYRRFGLEALPGLTEPNAIWHEALPDPPSDLLDAATISLAVEPREAEYLQRRILEAPMVTGSLLAVLARSRPLLAELDQISSVWHLATRVQATGERTGGGVLDDDVVQLTRDAELVGLVVQGGALVYNLRLAELAGRLDGRADAGRIEEARRRDLDRWRAEAGAALGRLRMWRPDAIGPRIAHVLARHRPGVAAPTLRAHSPALIRFLSELRDRIVATHADIADDDETARLVQRREERVKGRAGRSRFVNAQLRQAWGGAAGIGRLDYRFSPARRLLLDLRDGLGVGSSSAPTHANGGASQ
jgi:hypothetical protein